MKMMQPPVASMPADPAADDRHVIESMLNSDAWEEKLRDARLKREKVLADRANALVEEPVADEAKGGWPALSSARDMQAITMLPAIAVTRPTGGVSPVAPAAAPRRGAVLGVALGLLAGIGLGVALQPLATDMLAGLLVQQRPAAGQSAGAAPVTPRSSPEAAATASVAAAARTDSALPDPAEIAALRPPVTVSLSAGKPVVPGPGLAPEVSSLAPPIVVAETPSETALDLSALLPADGPPSQIGATPPALLDAASRDTEVSRLLSPRPTQIADVAFGPSSQMSWTDKVPEPPTMPMVSGSAIDSGPHPVPEAAPTLALSGYADEMPAMANVPYIAAAGGVSLNLHLSQTTAGSAIREKLALLGLENVEVSESPFASARNMVAYYLPEDAETASTLALLFDATAIDMVGFTPAPTIRKLDLYLTE